MKTLAIGCVAFGLALGGVTAQSPRPSADEPAVRDVVTRYLAAREKNDAGALGGLFTSDADQLTSSGEWRKGREELVKGTLTSSKQNAGKRTIEIESVRLLSADVAVADGRYEITGGATDRKMRTSFIMIRTKDGWRIAAIRNMLPVPG
jgi:uncharacterized protein (TIGR02246 family)